MKGNNVLIFNHATMVEAVQHYLNEIMVKSPVVQSVKQSEEHPSPRFEIEVGEAEQP